MAKTMYLDYAGLQKYDGLLKQYIGDLNLKNIKAVTIVDNTLRFYKVENPTETDDFIPIVLPKQDLSNFLTKIQNSVAGNVVTVGEGGAVVDSGIKSIDIATKTDVKNVDDKVGSLDSLSTTAKNNVVSAINEIKTTIIEADTSHKVALSVETTPSEGMLKTYTIKQGTTEVGKIDIPKDLVVTGGSIVVNPDGQEEGTYVELIVANQDNPIYINVKDLIDVYTAKSAATQVQVAISTTNEISATLVAGGVGTTELADNAVTSAKITDGQVTRAKISTEFENQIKALEQSVGEGGSVATQIENAVKALDADIKSAEAEEGKGLQVQVVEVDGKITTVGLTGHYDNKYDAKGAAAQALADAKTNTTTVISGLDAEVSSATVATGKGLQIQVIETDGKITAVNVSGDYSETYEAKGAAATALADAKTYADGKDSAMDTRVDSLETKVGEGFESITEDEISALFPTV